MHLKRYLLYFSYIGKTFNGSQRQVARKVLGKLGSADDPSTVQGRLETGLKLLNPYHQPIIYLSSRTDSGVHALSTTAHVDLMRYSHLTYQPQTITICLNKYLKTEEIPIRIQKTYLVPEDFNCRHAPISRTYLYRMAVIQTENLRLGPSISHIPIEEADKCLFICCDNFDLISMREASQLFLGLHDFRTFMGKGSKDKYKITRRIVKKIDIVEAKPLTYSKFSWPLDSNVENYKYYDIYVEAPGFLYRQVRRMVSTLVAVAQGKITSKAIKSMLEVPSHNSWDERIKTVPAYGLYLCQVEYSAEDKARFRERLE